MVSSLLGQGCSSGVEHKLTLAGFAEVALLTGVDEAIFNRAHGVALRTRRRVHTLLNHGHYQNATTEFMK